jgi:hypothetical protein
LVTVYIGCQCRQCLPILVNIYFMVLQQIILNTDQLMLTMRDHQKPMSSCVSFNTLFTCFFSVKMIITVGFFRRPTTTYFFVYNRSSPSLVIVYSLISQASNLNTQTHDNTNLSLPIRSCMLLNYNFHGDLLNGLEVLETWLATNDTARNFWSFWTTASKYQKMPKFCFSPQHIHIVVQGTDLIPVFSAHF